MVDVVRVLLAKKEATYGTDAAPTGALNAVVTRNFSSTPLEVDRLERGLDSGRYGTVSASVSNKRQTLSFEVEMAGSAAAGTAPPWMELLEACGMAAPVVVAATSATQKFSAAGTLASSLTVHHYVADQRRKGVGARGSWSLDMTAGEMPRFSISLTALLPAVPFDTSAPVGVDLTRWKEPREVNTENTDVLLDGFAANMRSLRIEAGVNANIRRLVGAHYVNRGNRSLTARLVIEAPALATKNYLQTLDQGTAVALAVTHGTVAGHTIAINAPAAQIVSITESVEDDILMWELQLALTTGATGAGDDLTIVAT